MKIADTLIRFFGGSVPLKEGALEFTYGTGEDFNTYKVTSIDTLSVKYLAKNGYRGTLDYGSNYSFRSARLRRTIRGGTKFTMDIA
jgi:hypothetical protein